MAASASTTTLEISASGMVGNEMTGSSHKEDEGAEEKPGTADDADEEDIEDVEGL